MEAIQIYEINAPTYLKKHLKKHIHAVQTYEDFKKLRNQLLSLNQNSKKALIIKLKQSLENNFNFMKIVDGEKFEVKIEKLKKQRNLQFKLTFSNF